MQGQRLDADRLATERIHQQRCVVARRQAQLGPARAEAFGLHGPFPKDGGLAVGDFAATPLEMTAVVEGQVVPLPEALLVTRPGPRIAEGLEALARVIHADAFD